MTPREKTNEEILYNVGFAFDDLFDVFLKFCDLWSDSRCHAPIQSLALMLSLR